jgi:hypothetical protein
MGSVYYRLGDYGKALEHHQQCLQIVRELQDKVGQRKALEGI